MKTTKDLELKIGHRPKVKPKDVYAKSIGKTSMNKELFKPLCRNMYK